jgi:F-type H+-transporting ATPase subunit c
MNYKVMFLALAVLLLASPMFGQTGAPATGGGPTHADWIVIASGFSMAIASGLAALGQGRAVQGAVEGIARNPGASGAIQGAMILGLAFMESLALFTLLIIFVKVV